MLFYDYFARTYNWTPDTVDELTEEQMYWLPVIGNARGEATEQIQDK
jgi:hypothetical protein